jgi:hypothetical protein
MAYLRTKNVGGRRYHQLVEGYREDGKVKQRVLAHLGRYESVEEALKELPRSIALRRRVLPRYPKKMQPGMLRRIEQDERRLQNLRKLRERGAA